MTRSPALIFDFGNVIAHFDYHRAAGRFGQLLGLSGEDFLQKAAGAGFAGLLREYESGRLTSEAFHRQFCASTGLHCDYERFAEDWRHIFWANEPVHRLIDALRRAGYTLVLGSNTNEIHAAHFREQFSETLRHFDRLVLSYEVGHVKPSAEFYRACVAAAGHPAEECVFIDDLPENIRGAREAGLVGVEYRTIEGLVSDLRAQGVEIAAGVC